MGVERFEAEGDAGRVAACYEIFRATRVADDPDVPVMPPQVFEGWLKTGWVGDPRETWLVADQEVRAHVVAARHDASGELGGFTQVEVGPQQPERGFQALTAVVRAHRGHRLGLLLKLAMMERLAEAEPQVRLLFTMNTETNEHMIAINETLGYRVLGKPARSWELPADKAAGRR